MTIKSDEFHLTLTTSNAWDLSSAGRASALQAEGHRFEPCRSHYLYIKVYADVAQLAEQLICNQQVIGSSPIIGFYTISYCIYGQIPEWPKGTDCKSAANCFGGSNPPLPIRNEKPFIGFFFAYKKEKIVKEITFLNTQIVKKVKISLSKWISYSILKVLIGNTWM